MSKYGVFIIGCGDMGMCHAKAWSKRKDSEIRCAFDPDPQRASKLAEDFQCEQVDDVSLALGRSDIDIVSVCTPVCFHADYTIAAAEAGKHVICEKPIALNLDEAKAMQDAAHKAGIQLAISYQYRGWPKFQKLKSMIDSSELAGPFYLRFLDIREVRPKLAMHRTSMNGGPLIDMAGHFFDMMRFLTQSEPLTIHASGQIFGADKQRLQGIEDLAVDTAEILVTYENGHTLSAYIHWGMPEASECRTRAELITREAVVDLNDSKHLKIFGAGAPQSIDLEEGVFGPEYTIDGLMCALSGDSSYMVNAQDGETALKVSLAALHSVECGHSVSIQDIIETVGDR